MKKSVLSVLAFIFLTMLMACNKNVDRHDLANHSFETGDLTSWSASHTELNLIKDDITFDGNRKYMKEGTYFLSTMGTNQDLSIKSKTFKLEGIGQISFLISGIPAEGVEVRLMNEQDESILLNATYIDYDGEVFQDNFVRVIWNAFEFLDQSLYIEIIDSSDYGYINVDAFDIHISDDDELSRYQNDLLMRTGIKTDDLLMSAEYYINLYKYRINPETRYTYHLMGEMGWINDPNGFVYYQDEYHLFYQHHPYSSMWGPMHWGHATSDDLIKWDYLPIALAPHVLDAGGGAAFSGSAIDVDGSLYLMYTENWVGYQHQVMAKSEDGISFELINEGLPVIDQEDLPFYANPVDFRDPKIFEKDGTYYAVIGSRQINDFGQVLLFSSENLTDWEYVGPVIQGSQNTHYILGYMFECPDIFELSGQEVLIMSPQQIPGHRNTHGTVYVVGNLNYETGLLEGYELSQIKEIDYGFDFYAPQTMIDAKGRRIMVAWMQSWNRSPMTAHLGWAGAMTVPRVIELNQDHQLIQNPVEEIEAYRINHQIHSGTHQGIFNTGFRGNTSDMEITFFPENGKSGVTVFADENNKGVHIYYENGKIIMDRTDRMNGRHPGDFYNKTEVPVELNEDGSITIRILLDRYSVEVFVNGGLYAMTSTIYASDVSHSLLLFSDEETRFDVNYWNLLID